MFILIINKYLRKSFISYKQFLKIYTITFFIANTDTTNKCDIKDKTPLTNISNSLKKLYQTCSDWIT